MDHPPVLSTQSRAAKLALGCYRLAPLVICAALLAACLCGLYAQRHFAINTDVEKLIDPREPWRQREDSFSRDFPGNDDLLVAVIDARTPDLADEAASRLADSLGQAHKIFRSVRDPEGGDFFRREGILFLPASDIRKIADDLIRAQGMLASLAADPTLRGLFSALDLGLQGVQAKAIALKDLSAPLAAIANSIESQQAGHPQPLSWQTLLGGESPGQLQRTRRFLLLQPILDYSDLEPGAAATNFVRQRFAGLGYTDPGLVRLRLTGPVALADEEFATVAEGSSLATLASIFLVSICLSLALRSWRLIAPILVTLFCGLSITSAFALWLYGSLNLISVAFAVMFIGIAVDFGLQYGVRYRAERYSFPDPAAALGRAAHLITKPLLLAAGATAAGFLAFTPTAYVGVSELGVIAAFGMVLAALLNLTLLPALLRVSRPQAESHPVGFIRLLPLDNWVLRHRRPMIAAGLALAIAASLFAVHLRFDFDPLHLKNQKSESVSTLYDLMKDPQESPYSIDIEMPDLASAQSLAERISKLPGVHSALTLASFVPEDQTPKLAILGDLSLFMGPALLTPQTTGPKTVDSGSTIKLISDVAEKLQALAATPDGGATAGRLATDLQKFLDHSDATSLGDLNDLLLRHWPAQLANIRALLAAGPVTLDRLPANLGTDWTTPDGRARIEVFPAGNMNDADQLRAFTASVRNLAPDATGAAISIQESAHTIVNAFIEAGILAVIAIGLLLLLALRNVRSVLCLLAPLALASALTAASCVLLGWPITYANIIALPLFLGLGVSFAIYFALAWSSGTDHLLSAAVTRAVIFSASTTMVAFGSLALSSHPGTRQMGLLLALALCYALATILVFLPPLLGPRKDRDAITLEQ